METTDDVPANNDLRAIPAVRGKVALRPHLRTPRRGGSRFELGLDSNLHSLDGGNLYHDIHYDPDRLPPLRKDFSAQLWISGSSIHGVSTGSATDGSRLLIDTLAVFCCSRHGFSAFFYRRHTVSGNSDSTKPNSTVLSASRRRIQWSWPSGAGLSARAIRCTGLDISVAAPVFKRVFGPNPADVRPFGAHRTAGGLA